MHAPQIGRHLMVLLLTTMVGLYLPEPYLTGQGSMTILLPAAVAGMLLHTRWIVVYTIGVFVLLIGQSGMASVYLKPDLIGIVAIIVVGIVVARAGSVATARTAAVAPKETQFQADGHVISDATQHAREQVLQTHQRAFFEALATGQALDSVLTQLACMLETQLPATRCSILYYDPARNLLVPGAIQSFTPEYQTIVRHGIPIGPASGSCGTAAYRQMPVICADIATDPLWTPWCEATLAAGLYAAFSVPFFTSTGDLLGTFAVWYSTPHTPDAAEVAQVQGAASLAAIAVERRHMETALAAREQRYRLITENSADLIAILDSTGLLSYTSPSYLSVLGVEPVSLIGTPAFARVHPDDIAAVEAAFVSVFTNQRATVQFRYQHASGIYRQIDAVATLLYQAPGEPEVLVVGHDMTERNRLQEQLRQAQKMEAIGRLAGGIAHDFNNLLVVIGGYAALIRDELPQNSSLYDDIDQICAATDRAALLTRQLLAFARKQHIASQVLDLNPLLVNLGTLLRRLIGESIDLQIRCGAPSARVKADPSQIEQVILNLATNARDAMPEGGSLLIEIDQVVLDTGYAREHAGVLPGTYIVLAVSDTGTGMDETVRAHIFEPFFTTKEQGKGTGLGLASSYGIVNQHGGHIWVYSEPAHGTTIKIYLPLEQDAVASLDLPSPPPQLHGDELILVAEDDSQVRELITRTLRSYGYTVLEAVDGEAALALGAEYKEQIGLLVTDMVMPRMGGSVLVHHLTAQIPQLRVLYISGYTDATLLNQQGYALDAALLLQKPFSPTMIAGRVRALLDSSVPTV